MFLIANGFPLSSSEVHSLEYCGMCHKNNTCFNYGDIYLTGVILSHDDLMRIIKTTIIAPRVKQGIK